ncbi:MAG: hypothetical protein IJ504_00885 [Bacteroidales bacterium]|nr:hypothetical protein [Bacteroidales bacterium]
MFIHLFTKNDFDARKNRKLKTKKKIAGDYLYVACKLTAWFRYKRYVIRLNFAYYLLGLNNGEYSLETNFSKLFDGKIFKDISTLDILADQIIRKYGEGFDFGAELIRIQEKYKNKEEILEYGMRMNIPFEQLKKTDEKEIYQALYGK